MLIAQISDCHLTGPDRLAYGQVDTAHHLRNAVRSINALPAPPDLIIVTGDIVQSGASEEYFRFIEIATALRAPVLPVAGNHDHRDRLRAAFALDERFDVQPGFIQYAHEIGDLGVIVIDTVTAGSGEPGFCRDRLAWLDAQLASRNTPSIIAMHHPPFPAGVGWMEPSAPDWASELERLIGRHPTVLRILCGHVHRQSATIWAGACAMTAPSTAHQVFLDLTPTGPPRFSEEAPGFLVHRWAGGRMTSYSVAVPGMATTFDPFTPQPEASEATHERDTPSGA